MAEEDRDFWWKVAAFALVWAALARNLLILADPNARLVVIASALPFAAVFVAFLAVFRRRLWVDAALLFVGVFVLLAGVGFFAFVQVGSRNAMAGAASIGALLVLVPCLALVPPIVALSVAQRSFPPAARAWVLGGMLALFLLAGVAQYANHHL